MELCRYYYGCRQVSAPDGLGVKYGDLTPQSNNKKVDLLINFAYGMDYRRSSKYLMSEDSDNSKFDEFFGTDEWRYIEKKFRDREDRFYGCRQVSAPDGLGVKYGDLTPQFNEL